MLHTLFTYTIRNEVNSIVTQVLIQCQTKKYTWGGGRAGVLILISLVDCKSGYCRAVAWEYTANVTIMLCNMEYRENV